MAQWQVATLVLQQPTWVVVRKFSSVQFRGTILWTQNLKFSSGFLLNLELDLQFRFSSSSNLVWTFWAWDYFFQHFIQVINSERIYTYVICLIYDRKVVPCTSFCSSCDLHQCQTVMWFNVNKVWHLSHHTHHLQYHTHHRWPVHGYRLEPWVWLKNCGIKYTTVNVDSK